MIKPTTKAPAETSGSAEGATTAGTSSEQPSSATLEAAARAEAEKLMNAPEEDALAERVASLETALSQDRTIIQHLCGRLGINPSALLTE